MTTPVIASFLLAFAAAGAAAQPRQVPADLVPAPRCAWGRLSSEMRLPLVRAAEAMDTTGASQALDGLRPRAEPVIVDCAPSTRFDENTGIDLMLFGFPQEAAGDLLAREMRLDRARLDQVIAAAPEALKTGLQKLAEQLVDRRTPPPWPALGPIYTALDLPSDGPADPRHKAWVSAYALGYFQVRAVAEVYDDSFKD